MLLDLYKMCILRQKLLKFTYYYCSICKYVDASLAYMLLIGSLLLVVYSVQVLKEGANLLFYCSRMYSDIMLLCLILCFLCMWVFSPVNMF